MTVQNSIYERPAAEILFDENDKGAVIIRASQATSCQRQLYYAVTDEERTNDVPPEAKARMEMGKALEPVVMDLLRDKGWHVKGSEIDEENPEKSIYHVYLPNDTPDQSPDIYMSGIPDAIGMDDGVCADHFAIEIKTRGTGPPPPPPRSAM